MSVSLRLLLVTLAIGVGMWFFLLPLEWTEVARDWLEREAPWLARLLDMHFALLAFATAWASLRDPRCRPGFTAIWVALAVASLFELRMSLPLGVVLALLAAVAMIARPWPNRAIMARCMALAGLAVGVAVVVG